MDFLDHYEAPLNPCSVETLPEPMEMRDGKWVWPVMTSCYELQEDKSRRDGRMDLFLVEQQPQQREMRLGTPVATIESSSNHNNNDDNEDDDVSGGVLDGKWFPKTRIDGNMEYSRFATARSSGQVFIHTVRFDTPLPRLNLWAVSKPLHNQDDDDDQQSSPLCLSLNWHPTGHKIVSSYSNGRIAIHDIVVSSNDENNTNGGDSGGDGAQLVLQDSWLAHTLFGNTPTEVWSAAFVGGNNDCRLWVASGGDDGKLKLWDANQQQQQPIFTLCFEAGVTVISPHPRIPHLFACGSYDETVALYDTRYMTTTTKTSSSKIAVGGGVWRLQWHPNCNNKLLVAAMHGGCRVLRIDNIFHDECQESDNDQEEQQQTTMVIEKEFTKHQSMAYGADWLVDGNNNNDTAVSCSFYDRAVYMWDANCIQ